MKHVTVGQLQDELSKFITNRVYLSVMMWGKPGIGKSESVRGAARAGGLELIDVRIGQLAPTDLRGLPYKTERYFVKRFADHLDRTVGEAQENTARRHGRLQRAGYTHEDLSAAAAATAPTAEQRSMLDDAVAQGLVVRDAVAGYAAPDFLPRTGGHALFLDELNQGSPAMMALAQQLILDRQIGSYTVPDEVYIWAAGNRKEDRASVNDMPTPVANRFVHYAVTHNAREWISWGLQNGLHPSIAGFIGFKPDLLHQMERGQMAWPSPRSWAMADRLLRSGIDVDAAVGEGPAGEYYAFARIYDRLPNAEEIVEGRYQGAFPTEISEAWAVTTAISQKIEQPHHFTNALHFITAREMRQVLCSAVIPMLEKRADGAAFFAEVYRDREIMEVLRQNAASMRLV